MSSLRTFVQGYCQLRRFPFAGQGKLAAQLAPAPPGVGAKRPQKCAVLKFWVGKDDT